MDKIVNLKRSTGATCAVVVAAIAIVSGGTVPAAADDGGQDALAAIAAATPETVDAAALVATGSGEENAIDATLAGIDVTVPVNPADGITLASQKSSVSIELPFAEDASDAAVQRPGVVAYDNRNGSTTVPVVLSDGSVQINTVIEHADAPTRYTYEIDLPDGAAIEQAGKGLIFLDRSGSSLGGLAPAWAKDATGRDVPTRYDVNGTTITQVIEHAMGDSYPVVGDPWLGVDLIARASVSSHPKGYIVNVDPTAWGRTFSSPTTLGAHEAELRAKLGSNAPKVTSTIREQFNCHIVGNVFEPGTYNMESWQRYMDWGTQLNLRYQCNPDRNGYY
jgi:hypothetical protein